MKTTKILTLLTALMMLLSFAACGTAKGNTTNTTANKKSETAMLTAVNPKTKDEAADLHQKLMAQENAILSENSALWEKVFASADKGMAMNEDGKNYGDFLLKTIDGIKDQFSADELKLLNKGAEEIKEIEGKLTVLEQKFPGCGEKPSDGDMSVPAENGKPIEKVNLMKFPTFDGKDLDGNEVKSSTLFAKNTVTVVNFWFTTCNPCVGELSELESLHQELTKKGGGVIGINSFTLGGDEAAISEAKSVLSKKGVTYPNVYFPAQGEAGKFVENVFAYPTTYVVDRSGNIVGDPIVGAITDKTQAETLQKLIDQALAADMG